VTPETLPALPTLASAMPRGDGDGCLSFSLLPSFDSTESVDLNDGGGGGAGDADLRVIVGRESVVRVGGDVNEVIGDGSMDELILDVLATGFGPGDGSAATVSVPVLGTVSVSGAASSAAGMSNSAGRFFGVAWTLVISLAREQ